jgi:hypothetical protein
MAIKVERTEGTPPTLVASNANNNTIYDASWSPEYNPETNNPHRRTFSKPPSTQGIKAGACPFTNRFRGSGTVGNRPFFGLPLYACGFKIKRIMGTAAVEPPVALFSNRSTGVTVASGGDGTYNGTGTRIWEILITTGGASATAKCSCTDLTGRGTNLTDQTITTATPIALGNNVTITFTGASMNMVVGDRWIIRAYDTKAVIFKPTTEPNIQSTGVAVASGGDTAFSGTGDREWYCVVSTAGASGVAKLSAVDLLGNGTAVTAQTITTATPIALGDDVTITFTGADMAMVAGDVWLIRVYQQGAEVYPVEEIGYIPTVAAGCYMDGTRAVVHGIRGNVSINLTAGESGKLNFDFGGGYNSPTDTALLSGITNNEAAAAPAFLDAIISLGGYTAATVQQISISSGNTIARRIGGNASGGIRSFEITDSTPTITINPEKLKIVNFDLYSKIEDGELCIVYASWGTTAGNKFEIEAVAQFLNVGDDEREGLDIATITGELKAWSQDGDDSLRIVCL